MNGVGILFSTCNRYRPVAEWTESLIDRTWADHPPLRRWGLGDERDWMTVTRDGVAAMQREGFRWIYLILDDHPPVGPCRAEALNQTLPALAEKLQAVNISLLGWGQRRGREGTPLGRENSFLLRNDRGYRWKFSLHPALWSVEKFLELLDIRISQFEPPARTPWNFERHLDAPDGPVGEDLLNGTYRVDGNTLAAGSHLKDALVREPLLFAFDMWRFFIRILRGQERRDAFDRDHLWLYHYYRGPYPILWSGAVRAGKPSRDFENFLRFTGRRNLAHEWRAVREKFASAC
ncbi:MAG: hypothetical protein ACO3YO_02935 [Chthoniobacterales bacterium]